MSSLRVIQTSLNSLDVGNLITSWENFPALLGIAHVSHYFILVSIWAEIHRCRAVVPIVQRLMSQVGDTLHSGASWPRRRTVVLARFLVVLLAGYGPLGTFVWQFWLAGPDGEMARVPAHILSNIVMFGSTGSFCLLYFVIADAADELAQRFARDMSCGMSAAELRRHRRVWVALRELLTGAMAMPVTVTLSMGWLVVNNLLCKYHILNGILLGVGGWHIVFLLAFSSQLSILFVTMCVAADAAVNAVAGFTKPLLYVEQSVVCDEAFVHEVFRDAFSYSPQSVCLGGFVSINRRLATSVFCVTLSYIIVLIEFRRGELDHACCANCTATAVT